jgi:phosphohistidine phosphatase SixA
MQLYLVRHATAEDRAEDGGDDPQRALTDEGQAEAVLLAQALRQMRIEPDAVLTSPYRRCLETAQPIASLLDADLVEERRLAPGFSPAEFSALWERHDTAHSLILVGHEPDLSALTAYFTGAQIRMPKGGVVRVEVGRARAACELRWFLRPKQVRLIAAAKITA